jgi:hypothetical protein
VLEFLKTKYLISKNNEGGLNISLPPTAKEILINPAPNANQSRNHYSKNGWWFVVVFGIIVFILIIVAINDVQNNSKTAEPVTNETQQPAYPNPVPNLVNKELINNTPDNSSDIKAEKEATKGQKLTFTRDGVQPLNSHIWYDIVIFNDKWNTGKNGIAYLVGSRIETIYIDHNLVDPESNSSIINGYCLISFKNDDGTINESNDLYFKGQSK